MRSYLRPLLPLLALLVGVYWVVIFTLTHIPPPVDVDIDEFDKLIHAGAYAGLAFLLGGVLTVWRGYRPGIMLSVWLLAFCYGAFDEFSQQFVPNRSADPLDLIADVVGATIGLFCVHLSVVAWHAYCASFTSVTERPIEA